MHATSKTSASLLLSLRERSGEGELQSAAPCNGMPYGRRMRRPCERPNDSAKGEPFVIRPHPNLLPEGEGTGGSQKP
jgi:hypothetical protein